MQTTTPEDNSLFSREKEELPRVGLEPAMYCILDRHSTCTVCATKKVTLMMQAPRMCSGTLLMTTIFTHTVPFVPNTVLSVSSVCQCTRTVPCVGAVPTSRVVHSGLCVCAVCVRAVCVCAVCRQTVYRYSYDGTHTTRVIKSVLLLRLLLGILTCSVYAHKAV